ncbi:hypothetical protein N9164_16445, partial [Draconibacterium sp.]|nr:hypothetical protein [Draconibacterium sp.]
SVSQPVQTDHCPLFSHLSPVFLLSTPSSELRASRFPLPVTRMLSFHRYLFLLQIIVNFNSPKSKINLP